MKNRKNVLILGLVALILVLGVGYAVVTSSTLTINGTAAAAETQLKVVYDGVNAVSNATYVTAISSPDDTRAATFTMEGLTLNQAQYADFEIKNKETDVNANIAVPTVTNSNATYFSYEILYKGPNDSQFTAWTSGTKALYATEAATIRVQVTLIKTPLVEANSSTTIGVTYVASPTA